MSHSPGELKNLVASPRPSFGCYTSKKTRNTQKVAKNQKTRMTRGLKHDLQEKIAKKGWFGSASKEQAKYVLSRQILKVCWRVVAFFFPISKVKQAALSLHCSTEDLITVSSNILGYLEKENKRVVCLSRYQVTTARHLWVQQEPFVTHSRQIQLYHK